MSLKIRIIGLVACVLLVLSSMSKGSSPQRELDSEVLVKEKLIACANIFPITSLYFWQGEMKDDNEVVLIAKTTTEKAEQVEKKIISMHSYKLPCILKFSGEANREYENWVKSQVKG